MSPSPSTFDPQSAVPVLERALERTCADMGFELLVVEIGGGPKRRVVRVFIDRVVAGPEGTNAGVTLDDCSKVSRVIGTVLDAVDVAVSEGQPVPDLEDAEAMLLGRVLGGTYNLEVSSPGLDRPLARRSHFEQHVGAQVRVQTHEPPVAGERQRKFHGHVRSVEAAPGQGADPRAGTLVLADVDGGAEHRIPIGLIRKANLVFEG